MKRVCNYCTMLRNCKSVTTWTLCYLSHLLQLMHTRHTSSVFPYVAVQVLFWTKPLYILCMTALKYFVIIWNTLNHLPAKVQLYSQGQPFWLTMMWSLIWRYFTARVIGVWISIDSDSFIKTHLISIWLSTSLSSGSQNIT